MLARDSLGVPRERDSALLLAGQSGVRALRRRDVLEELRSARRRSTPRPPRRPG